MYCKYLLKNQKKHKKTGFTIIEVILAIFILTTAAFGSFNLIRQVLATSSLNESRMTAYYFAQEAVEEIKNIRDVNYLQENDWRQGIGNSPPQKIFFLDGTESKFNRTIEVEEKTDERGNIYLEVKIIIEWKERTTNHGIEVVSLLYNWY